jgi:hypothetical protein
MQKLILLRGHYAVHDRAYPRQRDAPGYGKSVQLSVPERKSVPKFTDAAAAHFP